MDLIFSKSIFKRYDFILLDLGFSSNQLEDAQIGISFKADSKLNMNYLNSDFTAYDIVNNYSEEELSRVFADYGEIKQSLKLAKFIVRTRQDKSINTNFDLIEVLRGSGVNFRSKKIHFATQAFQALRIECNKELENLNIFLEKVYNYLNKDGILAIISFHSLEDRIVKKFFKENSNPLRLLSNVPIPEDYDKPKLKELVTIKKVTEQEYEKNPRSRSAKLRVAERI